MSEKAEGAKEVAEGQPPTLPMSSQGVITSATPVQVVKPTLRTDKDNATATSGCSLVNEGYGFVSMGLSTKPTLNNNSNNANNNNNEQVGDANNNSDDRLQGETLEGEEEPDFDWNDYLESTGSIAAPPTLFPHVEASLQTLFTEGMKIEVPNRFVQDTYWVAIIIMPCGPLLRLRYEGYDSNERMDDFWCEIVSGDIRPIGWCLANEMKMEPPPVVARKWEENWMEKLTERLVDAVTIPPYLFDSNGCTTIDQIKPGMKFEVQDELDLTHVWLATVMENVGGRMLLRYDGIYSNAHDFWLFYLSFRIHPFGWARGNECTYKPPIVLLSLKSVQEWANILNESMSAACKMSVPSIIFKNQEVVATHSFKEGMKLEALDPVSRTRICAATVAKVYNRFYFTVQFDQSRPEQTADSAKSPPVVCCHSRTPTIFPPNWAKANLLELEFWDRGESSEEFDWKEYVAKLNRLSSTEYQLAPSEIFLSNSMTPDDPSFEIGMKMEAVNPSHPNQISVATVCKVSGNLLWIQMDNSTILFPNHVVACNSHDIFPVGWCDSNGYTLNVPSFSQLTAQKSPAKKVAIVIPKKQQSKSDDKDEERDLVKESESTGRAWCPVIYVNHKCFTGPFLSISRIAGLPKQVGPGPIHLVLKEVLSMIVGVSYLPSRCLSVLQSDEEREAGTHQQLIKAKYKGRKYKAMVDIVNNSDRVREYCRSVCKKLQCCTNLFGPDCFTDNCPENCYSLTKSNPNQTLKRKKRRRKAKPVLVKNEEASKTSNGEVEHVKKIILDEAGKEEEKFVGEAAADAEGTNNVCEDEETKKENEDDSCEPPKEKRKYVHKTIPKSEIVTRGAKLPDFASGLGKRKHKNVQSKHLNVDKQKVNTDNLKTVTVSSTIITKEDKVTAKVACKDHSYDDNACNLLLEEGNGSSDDDHFQQPFLQLESNPLQWNIEQVSTFIRSTDCASMARLLKEQEIDGQALLLLTLPTIQEHLDLKLGPAIKLSNHIEQLKTAFYTQYGN